MANESSGRLNNLAINVKMNPFLHVVHKKHANAYSR